MPRRIKLIPEHRLSIKAATLLAHLRRVRQANTFQLALEFKTSLPTMFQALDRLRFGGLVERCGTEPQPTKGRPINVWRATTRKPKA